jgi:hypothetical protein
MFFIFRENKLNELRKTENGKAHHNSIIVVIERKFETGDTEGCVSRSL